MFRDGIGDSSEFAGYHPWVNLIFYILVIGLTMFSLSTWFLAVTFTMSWLYSVLLKGKDAIKINMFFTLWVLVIMALVNTFFVHDGVTPLFYINGNAITLEAFIYGLSAGIMLISVLIWFVSFNVIMSADKLIFIFGKATPVLGLTLSMIFRYIPLLQERFSEIHTGQACLGRNEQKGMMSRFRNFAKESSILVSWSLESSIESADSMEARGYGLKGRTAFHLYKFTFRDKFLLIVFIFLGTIAATGRVMGGGSVLFYPEYKIEALGISGMISLIAYISLLAIPIIIDFLSELKWRNTESELL